MGDDQTLNKIKMMTVSNNCKKKNAKQVSIGCAKSQILSLG